MEYEAGMNINTRELGPVIVSARRRGSSWRNQKVVLLTDNTQVQSMVNTGRSSSVYCMWWFRELFWLCFVHDFQLVDSHISSEDNIVPDFLSRVTDDSCPHIDSSHLSCLCCLQDGIICKGSWPPISRVGWLTQPRPPERVNGSVTF